MVFRRSYLQGSSGDAGSENGRVDTWGKERRAAWASGLETHTTAGSTGRWEGLRREPGSALRPAPGGARREGVGATAGRGLGAAFHWRRAGAGAAVRSGYLPIKKIQLSNFFFSKNVPKLVWHSRECVPLGLLVFLFAPTTALATLTLWLLTCASSFLAPSLHVIFPSPRGIPPQNLHDLQVHVIYISVWMWHSQFPLTTPEFLCPIWFFIDLSFIIFHANFFIASLLIYKISSMKLGTFPALVNILSPVARKVCGTK